FAVQIKLREQYAGNGGQSPVIGTFSTVGVESAPTAAEGLMQPVWFGSELILARRVNVGGRTLVQGCWLDWPELKSALATTVVDVVPSSVLAPVAEVQRAEAGRMLATIPAQLIVDPPVFAGLSATEMSPVRLALLAAWLGLLLAALAVGLLLRGVLALS